MSTYNKWAAVVMGFLGFVVLLTVGPLAACSMKVPQPKPTVETTWGSVVPWSMPDGTTCYTYREQLWCIR